MDFRGYPPQCPTGREKIMASLLDHNFPLVPATYDQDTFSRIMRDLEMALTKFDFPAVITGEDETNAKNWFLG